jgi:tRNA 2-thiouridine synthesizing protein A
MPTSDSSGPEPGDAEPPAPDAALDCRGLLCPLPVIKTREALTGLAEGEVLKVVATDPASELDLAAFSSTSGHPIVARLRDGEELVFFFRKG